MDCSPSGGFDMALPVASSCKHIPPGREEANVEDSSSRAYIAVWGSNFGVQGLNR